MSKVEPAWGDRQVFFAKLDTSYDAPWTLEVAAEAGFDYLWVTVNDGSQAATTVPRDEIRKLHTALGEWLKEQEAANGVEP